LEVTKTPLYVSYNANPDGIRVGDCVIRAISAATGKSWEETYVRICLQGLLMHDMPSADAVWGAYLRTQGFERCAVSSDCPECYTVEDFCREHPHGTYVLSISGHVVYVSDGQYFDSWDSGAEHPVYYWKRKE
jgi:hypothetical protein